MTARHNIDPLPDDLKEYLASEHDIAEVKSLSEMWARLDKVFPATSVDHVRKAEVRRHILRVAERVERVPIFSPARIFSIRGYAVAAALLILIGVGYILTPRVQIFSTPLGSAVPVLHAFSDGSTVYLAAGSKVSVGSSFGESVRKVSLQGEGFFDVVPSDVPFVVETYNASTLVVGTRFSVRAWPGEIEAETEVLVEEGIVKVAARRNERLAVELTPGQATSVAGDSDSELQTEQINVDQAFSWIAGGYEYRNEPIGNVLDDLGRRFALVIEAPQELRLRPISIFNQADGSIEEVLGDIAATIEVHYRRIAGGYELYAP